MAFLLELTAQRFAHVRADRAGMINSTRPSPKVEEREVMRSLDKPRSSVDPKDNYYPPSTALPSCPGKGLMAHQNN